MYEHAKAKADSRPQKVSATKAVASDISDEVIIMSIQSNGTKSASTSTKSRTGSRTNPDDFPALPPPPNTNGSGRGVESLPNWVTKKVSASELDSALTQRKYLTDTKKGNGIEIEKEETSTCAAGGT